MIQPMKSKEFVAKSVWGKFGHLGVISDMSWGNFGHSIVP